LILFNFKFLVQILRFGLPKAFRVFVGSAPLFFGFALSGTVWFGYIHQNFGEILNSLVTLMCLMHSDDLRNIFNRVFAIDLWTRFLSRIYLYSFQFIVFTIILNIFMVVLQETYMNLGNVEQTTNGKVEDDLEKELEDIPIQESNDNVKQINAIVDEIKQKIKEAQNGKTTQVQDDILKNLSIYCSELIHHQ
jgi:hypothetical protein